MLQKAKYFALILLVMLMPALLVGQEQPSHNWSNHAEVARNVIKKFDDLQSVTGNFQITTTEGGRTRTMNGRYYFQKPNKLRYEFNSPAGNLIVSNGNVMWFYIRRSNLVGRQDLTMIRMVILNLVLPFHTVLRFQLGLVKVIIQGKD